MSVEPSETIPAHLLKNSIPALEEGVEDFPVLGEGVWGKVADLRDGTVVKISRRFCDGIGDGLEKLQTEMAALRLLSMSPLHPALVPRALGLGEIVSSSSLYDQGYSLWLRLSKMEGNRISGETVRLLPTAEREQIGSQIGHALGRMHLSLRNILPPDVFPVNSQPHASAEKSPHAQSAFYKTAIGFVKQALSRVPPGVMSSPTHGDFNISNILFDEGLKVSAILDFAEFGRYFPEKDIGDILNEIPDLQSSLVPAYEEAAGFKIDEKRIWLACAENGLYGALIGESRKNAEDIFWGRRAIVENLERLGYPVDSLKTQIHGTLMKGKPLVP